MRKGVLCTLAAAVILMTVAVAVVEAVPAPGTIKRWNAQPVFGFDPTDAVEDPDGLTRRLNEGGDALTVCYAYENYIRGNPCAFLCMNPVTNKFCGVGHGGGIDRHICMAETGTRTFTNGSKTFGPGDLWNIIQGSQVAMWPAGDGRALCTAGAGTGTANLRLYFGLNPQAEVVDLSYKVWITAAFGLQVRRLDPDLNQVTTITMSGGGLSGSTQNVDLDSAENPVFSVDGSTDFVCRMDRSTFATTCWNIGAGKLGPSGFVSNGVEVAAGDLYTFAQTANGRVGTLNPATNEYCEYGASLGMSDVRLVAASGSLAAGNLQIFATEGAPNQLTVITPAVAATCRTCVTAARSTPTISSSTGSASFSDSVQTLTAATIVAPSVVVSPVSCGTGTQTCSTGETIDGIMRYPMAPSGGTTPAGLSGVVSRADGTKAIYGDFEGNDSLWEFTSCGLVAPPGNCGDGNLDAGEQCDDGNNTGGDGCSPDCEIETVVNREPTIRCVNPHLCTDAGVCNAAAACDPSVAVCIDPDGDPVTVTCDPPSPYTASPATATTAVTVTCSDGINPAVTASCTVEVHDDEEPNVAPPAPTTLECSSPCGSPSPAPAGSATDNCVLAGGLTSPPNMLMAGCGAGTTHLVPITQRDVAGYDRTAFRTVTVRDSTGPAVTPPPALVLTTCDVPGGVSAESAAICEWRHAATANDVCMGFSRVTDTAPPVFPVGCGPAGATTTVAFTGTDDCGNATTATSTVTVVDETAPTIESCGLDELCLWPPDHAYVIIPNASTLVSVSDDCDASAGVTAIACQSSQCDDAPCAAHPGENGDGHTTNDCFWDPVTDELWVRSERAGTEPEGRFYSMFFTTSDACGNEATALGFTIYVPHDQSPHESCLSPAPSAPK